MTYYVHVPGNIFLSLVLQNFESWIYTNMCKHTVTAFLFSVFWQSKVLPKILKSDVFRVLVGEHNLMCHLPAQFKWMADVVPQRPVRLFYHLRGTQAKGLFSIERWLVIPVIYFTLIIWAGQQYLF